ncbi:MAG: SRPBCC domain-containing protein [Pedobacter sp.]
MEKLEFKMTINAPKEVVWNILIGDETYPQWTSVFCDGSKVVTDWQVGSKALFLDGKNSGMVSTIEQNIPYSYLSIKHIGEVKEGIEDTESEQVKSWAGSHENYTLEELDDNTLWIVEMDATPEFADYMKDLWPKAQQKVKEMAETQSM